MKIIGVRDSSGKYEGTDYHNVILFCTEPFQNDKGAGLQAKSFKVKNDILTRIFGRQLTTKEIYGLIGQDANFYYDEYKNVQFVEFMQKEASAK